MGGAFDAFDDVFGGDVYDGTSEGSDVDADVLVGGVFHLDDMAFHSCHGTSYYLDFIAFGELGEELDGVFCSMEHLF